MKFIFLYLLLYCSYTFSQTQLITIYGKISDNKTSQPLSYASIGIKGKSIGTVSNSEGNFIIHIPVKYEQDTLYISMLGYETFKEIIYKLKNINLYKLKTKIFSIEKVDINAFNAKEIVQKAFKNVNKNYHQKPALYDIYFREYWKKDTVYVKALEVAAKMYYSGFQHTFSSMKFRVNNILKSNNYFNSITINALDINYEFIAATFRYFKKHSYKIDSLTYFDGHLIWVISADNQKNQEEKEWAKQYISVKNENDVFNEIPTNDSILVENKILRDIKYYITVDKFVILKIILFEDARYMVSKKFITDFVYDYVGINLTFKILNNNAYINHFSRFMHQTHYINNDLNQKNYEAELLCEFYVNNIDTVNVKEIPKNELTHEVWDLYEQNLNSDTLFWKTYNYLVDDSLRKKVYNDINRLDSLYEK